MAIPNSVRLKYIGTSLTLGVGLCLMSSKIPTISNMSLFFYPSQEIAAESFSPATAITSIYAPPGSITEAVGLTTEVQVRTQRWKVSCVHICKAAITSTFCVSICLSFFILPRKLPQNPFHQRLLPPARAFHHAALQDLLASQPKSRLAAINCTF